MLQFDTNAHADANVDTRVNGPLDVTVFPKPVMVGTGPGPGPGPEWVTVYYVKPSHCNLCGT